MLDCRLGWIRRREGTAGAGKGVWCGLELGRGWPEEIGRRPEVGEVETLGVDTEAESEEGAGGRAVEEAGARDRSRRWRKREAGTGAGPGASEGGRSAVRRPRRVVG